MSAEIINTCPARFAKKKFAAQRLTARKNQSAARSAAPVGRKSDALGTRIDFSSFPYHS
jgi:hypothetical protein